MPEHAAVSENECACGWRPERPHGARMNALLLSGHIETANNPEPPPGDDQ